ncbi:1,4-alpha-glucan branching protein GlgB [Nocardioides sp. zg-536]|uniref:1,4-alpha-glucan branching enzyme GlgB n=1 Tax=Nocardioides faecalis TaxID=2803858 RepID=A0A938Y1V2_9ACTN|nr:1,4-alpha-glucan branching protein GlgB [Nocardioides faecalis]MBM9460381.1 1,4-alpha-glucan branching protein GlgB [Nocardioides faecalis]MBS4751306.1 1,4-alpha-glucan branching protein GlgB [Nocardioides faecalis]QVI59792.1 1,4-alpha-glucan branching protein GlgB [Nocardioides faecalis]
MPPSESRTPTSFVGEMDLHLVAEGRHELLWQVLGAHVRTEPTPGTSFVVWAPKARQVAVIGDFNGWDGQAHRMESIGSGLWEAFVPGAGEGACYKYLIEGADGVWREKADPMAFHSQVAPETASRVYTSRHVWHDEEWLAERARRQPVNEPMATYEMHLGSWKRHPDGSYWTYDELAADLPGYLADLGFTHVELMPVMQHPFGGSWGYHVTSYFAPDPRFGDPDGFRRLVEALHAAGIAVILDWVPGHFATDEWALVRFDGTPTYEHPDPQRGWHPEWGSYIFDFGRPEVRNFLVANALYWLEEYHVDGLRVDGVASMLYLDYGRNDGEWTPNRHGGHEHLEAVQFLQELNATAYKRVPGIVTIAEESTAWPGVTGATSGGGLGFGFKWNMGWMHDSLRYLAHEPVHRAYHHDEMAFSLVYAFSENYVLPLSHDEVVHGKGSLLRKMPGDRWQQLATLRAYLAYMWAHPGKQLLMMGSEFAQDSEWAESRELDWFLLADSGHRGLHDMVRDLNSRYREHAALWRLDHDPAGFAWIDAQDAGHNTFAFTRRAPGEPDLVCVTNFAAVPHDYTLSLPVAGEWAEVLNTDAAAYGGSGVGNLGVVHAVPTPAMQAQAPGGSPAQASLVLPPLATLWLRAPDAPAAAVPAPPVAEESRTADLRTAELGADPAEATGPTSSAGPALDVTRTTDAGPGSAPLR